MQTDDERREKARIRAQKSRAKKRAERNAQEQAARDARDALPKTPMADALEKSIEAMKWLTMSDGAALVQAQQLAQLIDRLTAAGDFIRALSAHRALTSVLTALGGTPIVRQQHELRSLRIVARTGGADGGDDEADKPAEGGGARVSKFERPPKRSRR